ncbi:MAG: molybdopterin-dependent oxidoreductase [Planctomycetaceae bacterium]|nr:molybdopterin-dependent oxidoreductase [Planctomycetaceae bacterium]
MYMVGENPFLSDPNINKVRKALSALDFLVVQDIFLTETAEFADVVLPAALWGEKTGTFTNSDRTVHVSLKAVDPPGEARSDLDIFLDFAQRMSFRDKDGKPLVKWTDPAGAFEAWKECSRGCPCDYSGLSYELLQEGSGLQWPCTAEAPRGTERLYTDGRFPTAATRCQTYGHDLATGAAIAAERYKAADPAGRAILRPADVYETSEEPDAEYPFLVTTGRVVHHFHTRTKTGRVPGLNSAAPDVFVQLNEQEARRLGVQDGDLVAVETRRGRIEGAVRTAALPPGHLFVPFHYGWFDAPDRVRAANELTEMRWDPVSKQPTFKRAAARLRRIEAFTPPAKPAQRTKAVGGTKDIVRRATKALGLTRPHLAEYLGILAENEEQMAQSFVSLRSRHPADAEVAGTGRLLETWSREHLDLLRPFMKRYGSRAEGDAKKLRQVLLGSKKPGSLGLVRDLHDLWVLAHGSKIALIVLRQAGRALRDPAFESTLERLSIGNERQIGWILTKLKQTAPQALVVPT